MNVNGSAGTTIAGATSSPAAERASRVNGSGHTLQRQLHRHGRDRHGALRARRARIRRRRYRTTSSAARGPETATSSRAPTFYNGLDLDGSGHVVHGNFIGTDATGHARPRATGTPGIVGVGNDLTIGGTSAGRGQHDRLQRRRPDYGGHRSSRASRSGSAATASTANKAARRPRHRPARRQHDRRDAQRPRRRRRGARTASRTIRS